MSPNLSHAELDALAEACDWAFGALWHEPDRRVPFTEFDRLLASPDTRWSLVLSELLDDNLVTVVQVDGTWYIQIAP